MVLKVRIRFRIVTITLRPLTLRQLQLVTLQLADALELSTGLSTQQVRGLPPRTISELTHHVDLVNAWDPVALAKELDKEDPNDKAAQSLEDFAAELIAAGHREDDIWNYWPEKFCFYLRQARRARARRELIQKKAFTEAACAAVGRFSEEGAKHASNLIKSLAVELRKLDEAKP